MSDDTITIADLRLELAEIKGYWDTTRAKLEMAEKLIAEKDRAISDLRKVHDAKFKKDIISKARANQSRSFQNTLAKFQEICGQLKGMSGDTSVYVCMHSHAPFDMICVTKEDYGYGIDFVDSTLSTATPKSKDVEVRGKIVSMRNESVVTDVYEKCKFVESQLDEMFSPDKGAE